jgi:hypothetical protein
LEMDVSGGYSTVILEGASQRAESKASSDQHPSS